MPHIKVVFLWPYARVGGVHPAYARAYAYQMVCIQFVHMHTANTACSSFYKILETPCYENNTIRRKVSTIQRRGQTSVYQSGPTTYGDGDNARPSHIWRHF